VSSSQSKPTLSNSSNVGGKAINSIKKAVAIKNDSEEAKPLVSSSNGRYESIKNVCHYVLFIKLY
jgi:hypothetical protein